MTNLFEIDFIVDSRIFSIYFIDSKENFQSGRDFFIKAQTIYQKEHGLDVRFRCFSKQKCVRLKRMSSNKCKSNLACEFTIHVRRNNETNGQPNECC